MKKMTRLLAQPNGEGKGELGNQLRFAFLLLLNCCHRETTHRYKGR
jgi:hypothetical protein